jgi:hypothetical protein
LFFFAPGLSDDGGFDEFDELLGDVNYKLPPTTTTSPLELPTSSAS